MLSKYVWFISVEKISFIRSCDVEEIKATDNIIKVHITSGNIKWRSFALRFHASNHKRSWQPRFPLRRAYLLFLSYTLYKSHGDLHLSFLHFILGIIRFMPLVVSHSSVLPLIPKSHRFCPIHFAPLMLLPFDRLTVNLKTS